MWIQINNACNLACTHCLVSSGPGKEPGLPVERLKALVDQAVQLGLERLYLSLTVRDFKFQKTDGRIFRGHRAVYLGPGKALVDEEGHLFPRNEPYEVCTDTMAKPRQPSYNAMFGILEPGEEASSYACCDPDCLPDPGGVYQEGGGGRSGPTPKRCQPFRSCYEAKRQFRYKQRPKSRYGALHQTTSRSG